MRKARLADFLRAVWSEGRLDEAARYVADAYTIHHDPGDAWEGRTLDLAGYVDRVRVSRAPFPDQKFDVQAMFDDVAGGGVVATWRWTATHLGDIPGFPASGKPIAMSGITAYFFDEADRLTGHWQVVDRLGVYQQLQRNAG